MRSCPLPAKHRTIGRKHKVTVPEAFFKVILSTRNGHPKAIGFIFKNLSGNHPLKNYVNSVDEVERITGIDFFLLCRMMLRKRLKPCKI